MSPNLITDEYGPWRFGYCQSNVTIEGELEEPDELGSNRAASTDRPELRDLPAATRRVYCSTRMPCPSEGGELYFSDVR